MDDETKRAERAQRDRLIYEARQRGLSAKQVGQDFGMTDERVRQICRAQKLDDEERRAHEQG